MKNVLYYPNFFVEDENWLKFALMYLDKLVTIIPIEAKINMTPSISLIRNHTDLLDGHSPSSYEVNEAAIRIGEELGIKSNNTLANYIKNSERYNAQLWKDRSKFNYELYNGKLPNELIDMFLDKGYAETSENGILVNEQIAKSYMAILASVIGETKKIPTITEKKNRVNFSSINRHLNNSISRAENFITVGKNLEINLPRNLEEISIGEIIEFRENEKVSNNRKHFQNAIEKLNVFQNENINESEFKDIQREIDEALSVFNLDISLWFGLSFANLVQSYTLLQNPSSDLIDLLGPGLGFGISAYQGVQNILKVSGDYKTFHGAKNYITSIEKYFD